MQIPDDIDYSCPQEGDDIPDDRLNLSMFMSLMIIQDAVFL